MDNYPKIEDVQTADDARELAIYWSNGEEAGDGRVDSYEDILNANAYFTDLAVKFPELADEFKENAVI